MQPQSLYIHIPFCKKRCAYCDFFSTVPKNINTVSLYVKALCSHLEYLGKSYNFPALRTVYIGGGTPSVLSVSDLDYLLKTLERCFNLKAFKEFEATIELNPDDISSELLNFLDRSFITRISVGIQSVHNKTLKSMNRRCDADTLFKVLELLKTSWKKRLSLDTIAGYPGETAEDLQLTLESLVRCDPDHISLYSLCVEEGTPLFDKIQKGELQFNSDFSDELWLYGKKWLKEHGYFQYEISNFARACSYPLSCAQHNLVYWHLQSYLGAGAGACQTVFDSQSIRITHTTDLDEYIKYWTDKTNVCSRPIPCKTEILDPDDVEYEFLMMNFRLAEGCDSLEYERRFGKTLGERVGINGGVFSRWQEKGLADISADGRYFFLTEEGLSYLNSFLVSL